MKFTYSPLGLGGLSEGARAAILTTLDMPRWIAHVRLDVFNLVMFCVKDLVGPITHTGDECSLLEPGFYIRSDYPISRFNTIIYSYVHLLYHPFAHESGHVTRLGCRPSNCYLCAPDWGLSQFSEIS